MQPRRLITEPLADGNGGGPLVPGAVPIGDFPCVHVPLYLPFPFGAVVELFVHPRLARPIHTMEWSIIALVLTSIASVIIVSGVIAAFAYAAWLAFTTIFSV